MRKTIEERFWAKVDKTGDCWVWTGARLPAGYGRFGVRQGLVVYAHRLSYEWAHGAIPDGLQVHHKCFNKPCVNPDHLDAVSQRENLLASDNNQAAINRGKTHCLRGHPLLGKNLRISTAGSRRCRACDRMYARNQRERHASKAS